MLQTGVVPSDWANQDLWNVVLQALIQYDGCLRLQKVSAHRVLREDMSFDEQHHVKWNAVADTAAKTARLTSMTGSSALSSLACSLGSSLSGVFAGIGGTWSARD